MKPRRLSTFALALLTLAACSRGSESDPGRNGTITGSTGLTVNAAGLADCMSPNAARPGNDVPQDERVLLISCINAAGAAQVNAQLPRQMDEMSRLDRITTEGPLLIYNVTITRPASALPPGTLERLATSTRSMVCSTSQMRQTIQMGGAYAYRWSDSQGQPLHQVRIDAC